MACRLLILEREHPQDLATYAAGLADLVAAGRLEIVSASTEEEALRLGPACDAIAAKAHHVPADLPCTMPALRWVQSLTTGVDHLLAIGLPAGVAVTSVRGIHGPQMAELAFLAMLSLARDYPAMLDNQRGHRWTRWPQRTLDGRTLLVVGLGSIAEAIAARAAAFGMRVTGASGGRTEAKGFAAVTPYARLAEAAAGADFVVVVSPYSAATHHLVDAAVLDAMHGDALLINIARGNVVDEAALLDTLRRGAIAGAWLDVFAQEPLPAAHPFWDAPNLLLSPHIGGMSARYAEQALPILRANLLAFIDGRPGEMVNRVSL